MDDIFVYIIDLPDQINEMVTPCCDGYTVYINAKLSHQERVRAYQHAVKHIEHGDFDREDVQEIEYQTHKEES